MSVVTVNVQSVGDIIGEDAVKRAVREAVAAMQTRTEARLDTAELEWMLASVQAAHDAADATIEARYADAARALTDSARYAACAYMVRPVFAVCSWLSRAAHT